MKWLWDSECALTLSVGTFCCILLFHTLFQQFATAGFIVQCGQKQLHSHMWNAKGYPGLSYPDDPIFSIVLESGLFINENHSEKQERNQHYLLWRYFCYLTFYWWWFGGSTSTDCLIEAQYTYYNIKQHPAACWFYKCVLSANRFCKQLPIKHTDISKATSRTWSRTLAIIGLNTRREKQISQYYFPLYLI